jgi:hypothetical protein
MRLPIFSAAVGLALLLVSGMKAGAAEAAKKDMCPRSPKSRVDDKKQPLGPQLTSYMLRLDRMPEGSEWRERPLAELMALYRRPDLNLPPPNLADPPRDKGQKGVELGKWSMTKPQPWHGLAPEPWPSPGAKQPKPQAGAYIPEDRLDAPG